jgi:hypothetical protein
MQKLTANVLVETGLRGANHGLVTASGGIVLIARLTIPATLPARTDKAIRWL